MIDPALYPIDCTGDACTGDVILFRETVYGGTFRSPRRLGVRRIVARIVSDSYGAAKQQHTFSLEILASDGVRPLAVGARTTRKGRNVYRKGTRRQAWADEGARGAALAEKHRRGDAARAERAERKASAPAPRRRRAASTGSARPAGNADEGRGETTTSSSPKRSRTGCRGARKI